LAAFREAARLGADMVEFDVQMSADNIPVVIHDGTVDRFSGHAGEVRRKTLAELRSIDAGRGERIPTLDEAIQTCREALLGMYIELKTGAAIEAVAARARRRGWTATRLRVQGAFHSPAMLPAASALAPVLAACQVSSLRRPVISTTTASLMSPGCNLRSHLLKHITDPVRFIEAMDQVATFADLCIEVGSGSNLSRFVAGWLDLPVLPLDVAGDTIDGLMQVLATAYVHGANIDPTALAAGPPAVTLKDLSSPIQTDGAGHSAWGAEHRAGGCWSPMLS
jgi:hypothetical protein